jgi:uracil-DNA glycosylase family 4
MSTERAALFHAISTGDPAQLQELDREFPFFPLTSPQMPLPGNTFIANAMALGDAAPVIEGNSKNKRLTSHGPALHYLYRRALYDEDFQLNVNVRGQWQTTSIVPGHLLGDRTEGLNGGPRPARVMLIGKNPGQEEISLRQNFVGPTSGELFNALQTLGVGEVDWSQWYATNLVKWPQLDRQSDSIPEAHKKDCALLLEQEIRLVRPDYILCLGSDASKWLLGSNCGVQSMVGRVMDYTVSLSDGAEPSGQPRQYHTAKVMAVTHPAQVYRRPEMFDEFKAQIGLFIQLVNGAEIGGKEHWVHHRNIYKYDDLRRIVDEIRSDPDPWRRVIAIDGEWEKDYPTEPGAYLRTVQFSSKHGEAYTVVLRHQGGSPAFQPSIGHAVKELNRLFKYDEQAGWWPRIGGHFFRSDLPWLISEGIDVRREYAPAATYQQCRNFGGWDTSLAIHAVNEATSYGLEEITARHTTAPPYYEKLLAWREGECKRLDIPLKHLEGYGNAPSWIISPEHWEENPSYSGYDADVTRRAAVKALQDGGLLDSDWNGNPSWEPYWLAHRASLGFLEMEMNGIMLDKVRVDELTTLFMEVQEKLLQFFRQRINWPTFNPKSHPQCVEFLFGEQHSVKRDKTSGQRMSVRPPGAVTLNLTPLTTTGKRPKNWADVVAHGEQEAYTPSTNKEVLGILGHEHKLAMILRDLKFITQVLSGPLRRPTMDLETGELVKDDDDFFEYEEGMAGAAHADGRVRTHLSQCKETGRLASYRQPMQNLSKRREGDYARILGMFNKKKGKADGAYLIDPERNALSEFHPDFSFPVFDRPRYLQPIRTIFRAAPGCVLVEADYSGAELAVLAWMCGDPTMIDHVRRGTLPEDHPDYFDIHAQTAVRVFQLPCIPTKKGMGKEYAPLRVAAKNVNFGIPYGRAAEAIARQCKEEGVQISVEDTQRIIDFYFQQYPGTEAFLAECRRRSQEEKWLAGCFGRMRRFVSSRERSVIGEQQRQAQNFPIQNTVADAVNVAVWNLMSYRWEHPEVTYRMLLQIHDALLFEVPIEHLHRFAVDVKDDAGNIIQPCVLRECMVNRVPIWPRHLDNTPMAIAQPYHFGIGIDVHYNWGQDLTHDEDVALGLAA